MGSGSQRSEGGPGRDRGRPRQTPERLRRPSSSVKTTRIQFQTKTWGGAPGGRSHIVGQNQFSPSHLFTYTPAVPQQLVATSHP